jgi:hypothetical protein
LESITVSVESEIWLVKLGPARFWSVKTVELKQLGIQYERATHLALEAV